MGYCPFLVLGHDTTDCIVTQQGTGARSRGPRHGSSVRDTASNGPRHGKPAAHRAHGLATGGGGGGGGCLDTMVCIMAGGQPLCRDTAGDVP